MTLDEILRAQPAAIPPPPPRRVHKRYDYTGWMQRHVLRTEPDSEVVQLLGAEYFEAEPEPPKPSQVVPEGMHLIGDLAKALGRRPRTVYLWIKRGVLPDAPARTTGQGYTGGLGITNNSSKRLWPAEEINAIVQIAQEEGIIDNQHRPLSDTNFVLRVWDAIKELRASAS